MGNKKAFGFNGSRMELKKSERYFLNGEETMYGLPGMRMGIKNFNQHTVMES